MRIRFLLAALSLATLQACGGGDDTPAATTTTADKTLSGANVFEDKLLAMLHPVYGNLATAPVFIQSFEVANLQYLRTKTRIRLVQLIDADDVNADGSMSLVAPYRQPYDFVVAGDPRLFSDLLTSAGMDFVKTYADAGGGRGNRTW